MVQERLLVNQNNTSNYPIACFQDNSQNVFIIDKNGDTIMSGNTNIYGNLDLSKNLNVLENTILGKNVNIYDNLDVS